MIDNGKSEGIMNDIYGMPKEVFGLAAGLLVVSGAIASFFYVRSSYSLPVERQSTNGTDEHNVLLRAEAFSKYRTLLEEINSDRATLIQCLRDFNQESSFLKMSSEKTSIKTYHSMDNSVYCPAQNEVKSMRTELDLLMNTYPKSNFGTSVTPLEINGVYDELKSHHSQVVTIAESFIPSLRALLNEAKLKYDKTLMLA